MEQVKTQLLTILRNKETDRDLFRTTALQLTRLIVHESAEYVEWETCEVITPIEKTSGIKQKYPIVVIPVLRSGLAMLGPFQEHYNNSKVGFLGFVRDEKTFVPHLYYEKLPPIGINDQVIVVDPMVATGNTACHVMNLLEQKNISSEKVIFCALLAAPEGMEQFKTKYPKAKLIVGAIDKHLNKNNFIVPGIGDFGDRYFGT